MPKGAGTRSATSTSLAELVGGPGPLPVADLATRRNVLQQMLQVRLSDPRDPRHIPIMELANKVGKALVSSWLKCNQKLAGAIVKEKEVRKRRNRY